MAYNIILEERVHKDLKKIPKNIRDRCIKGLESLKENPLFGIPLGGVLKGKRKIRIGDYRIVYKLFTKEKTIVVYRIESRQSVYKN